MGELEQCLKDTQGARTRLIATDGVFSMDGFIARLGAICDLAERYDALVMVDDSHATGFMGASGRGTPEHCGVAARVDILTGTLGKALGGGSGGYIAARREVIEWLRQRSRPYLFSNSIPPVVAAASLAVLDLLEHTPGLRAQLFENARLFRAGLTRAGFDLKPGEHPIIPVMLGEATLAGRMAERLLEEGVYVIGFSYPVVPKGQARIRTQMSAALTPEELERALGGLHARRPRTRRHPLKKNARREAKVSMKALVKQQAAPGIWLEDIPEPKVGPNDVLIKIAKTAICGTDMHIYKWDAWAQKTIPVPMAVGHEYCGRIVELGSEVKGLKSGDRVSGEGHITCGHCRNCRAGRRHLCRNTIGVGVNRPGAFAEYLSIPADNTFKLADSIGDDIASILDPFGNATHTALAFNVVGEDVLITGAGPIGIMATAIARFTGARHVVVTDVNDYRLELARKMGATRAINVQRESLDQTMKDLGMQEGFDVGLEMSGNAAALREMLRTMHHGGSIAILGIPPEDTAIDWNQVIFKGLTLKGIYGREMFETWYKMASLLQSGLKLDPIITHHFPVQEYIQGFETMGSGKSGKVILDWSTL